MPVTPTTYAHPFAGLVPPARFNGTPWVTITPRQSLTDNGGWTVLSAITLPVEATPSNPSPIDVEVADATIERGYFEFEYADAGNVASAWTPAVFSPFVPAAQNAYASPDQLREALDNASISDDQALRTIKAASQIIDRLVGPIPVDALTGQKLRVAGLLAWQREKLADATTTIGAVLFTAPNAFLASGAVLVQGPDFRQQFGERAATVNPKAAYALRAAVSLLDDAYLRRLVARLVP